MSSRPFMKTKWKDLSWMEGRELRLRRWIWDFNEFREPPAQVIFVKDYGGTVLLDLVHTACEWGVKVPPRHLRHQISKAAMAVGDIIAIDTETGTRLIGAEVTEYLTRGEIPETFHIINAEDFV